MFFIHFLNTFFINLVVMRCSRLAALETEVICLSTKQVPPKQQNCQLPYQFALGSPFKAPHPGQKNHHLLQPVWGAGNSVF